MLSVKLLLLLVLATALTESRYLSKDGPLVWWQKTAIYQIYPRSFKDSDNNGIGDLNGIISKLQYFKDTGIGALWLSPVYPSPMKDFGYDISDFKNISSDFGTLEDFDELVKEAHSLGIKIIMDFVPNHSSDQHEWFKKSVNREPDYDDFYIWKDPKGFDENGKPIAPNNWLSEFRGSAWEYNEQRKQFYLHKFVKEQPDLNYRNPKLVQEMKDVLTFWMERGVDGFRIDAIDQLFEDDRFLDEPVAYPEIEDHEDPEYLQHIYTKNQPETIDMVQQWREVVDKQSAIDGVERMFTVEIYADMDTVIRYYGTDDRPGAHFPFNFQLVGISNSTTTKDFKRLIDDWFDHVPKNKWSNWVIGNHDRHRVGSRVGSDIIDGMNILLTLLPGTSVTYYGEEIGMIDNTDITYEEGVDPWGCNYPPEEFSIRTRDFERTPFQWDSTVNAGFNTGGKTWLPVHSNYETVNLEAEKANPNSHYNVYKDLIQARSWPVAQTGKVLVTEVGQGTLAVVRSLNSEEFLIALINFSNEDDKLDLDYELLISPDKTLSVYTASEGATPSKGSTVAPNDITLSARGSVVLTYGISQTPKETYKKKEVKTFKAFRNFKMFDIILSKIKMAHSFEQ